jgi:hypothetical protein
MRVPVTVLIQALNEPHSVRNINQRGAIAFRLRITFKPSVLSVRSFARNQQIDDF